MAHLSLSFLEPFRVMLAGQPAIGFEYNHIRALLIYLAVEAERPHPREVLAGLLWPDWPNSNALANLRHALALYRGPFLEGFTLSDSGVFEGWATLKREQLARQMLEVLGRLAAYHEGRGEYEQAEGHAQRQLELDPSQEEAHRQWMRTLALGGRRRAALAQYQSCRRVLAEELGVEPAPETTALYESIRQGTFASAAPPQEGPPPPPAAERERALRLSNLPAQAAPFVGRQPAPRWAGGALPSGRLSGVAGPPARGGFRRPPHGQRHRLLLRSLR